MGFVRSGKAGGFYRIYPAKLLDIFHTIPPAFPRGLCSSERIPELRVLLVRRIVLVGVLEALGDACFVALRVLPAAGEAVDQG